MADTHKTTYTFDITFAYADDDTRTIKIPDPINNINSTTAKAYATELGRFTLSDRSKGNETIGRFASVVGGETVIINKTDLDLGSTR